MPTRCNRGFYCRSYCLLNMFRATLCPSSGAQDYYTVGAACGISCCGFQVAGLMWSWGLCARFAGFCSSTPDQQLENHSTKYHRQQPPYNTLELLMMGIVMPETCWASNKIRNKKPLLHLVGILFPHINDDAGQNHIKFIMATCYYVVYTNSVSYIKNLICVLSSVYYWTLLLHE